MARRVETLVFTTLVLVVFATAAHAHVKWFYPYDVTIPPRPIGEVLNRGFITFYLISMVAVYLFYCVDRFLWRRGVLRETLSGLIISQEQAFWLMRIATSILFLSLFVIGLLGGPIYLTPELTTEGWLVPVIQLALGIVPLFRPTVPLAGVGIIVLYAMAMSQFGVFHLLDYPVFLGIAGFFIFAGMKGQGWVTARYVAIFAATGITLGWGAIEKFAYPNWTYPLLDDMPYLLMGFPPELYMVIAGFIEFNLAFVLLSSASVLSRLIAFAFNAIFILAIGIFGFIDAVGHLLIITVLIILAARGPTPARDFLVLPDKAIPTEAYFMTGLWMLAMNLLFIAYYGLHTILIGS
ncbi:MAG: hypothetical protein AAGD34_16545 [Pseudomonadota bacterium]